MKAFTSATNGTITARLSRDEALLLQSLASQVSEVLRSGNDSDPALLRLIPDAYADDVEASAEFRRFTAADLVDRKVANADTVMVSLSSAIDSGTLALNSSEAQAWLRCLTDIRLTLASRLGIERDDQEPSDDTVLQDLYDWLGYLQNSLIEAIEEHDTVQTCRGMGDG